MKFRKKPVVIEAITFDQLVAHGRTCATSSGDNGVPWSFDYQGQHITHENDDCYLIPTPEGTMKFTRGDMLITGVKGEIYPCKQDIFDATYDPEFKAVEVKQSNPNMNTSDAALENRFTHHPPKGNQGERYTAIRAKVLDTAKFIRDNTPASPEQSRAFNALDEAMFLANAAIARHE